MRPPSTEETAHYGWPGDDPPLLHRLVAELDAAARGVVALAAAVRAVLGALRSAWPVGPAGNAAVHDVQVTSRWVSGVAPRLTAAAGLIGDYAGELDRERRRLEDLDEAWAVLAPSEQVLAHLAFPPPPERSTEWERADTDLAVARRLSGFRTTTEVDAAYAALVRRVRLLRDDVAAELVRVGRGAARAGGPAGASSYGGALLLLGQEPDPLAAALARVGLAAVPTTAAGVRAFWATLTGSERARLLAGDPARWGATDGVPVRDRDLANRRLLQADLAAGAALLARAGLPGVGDPEQLDALLRGLTLEQRVRLAGAAGVAPPWSPLGAGTLLLPPDVLRALSVYGSALGTAGALGLAAGVPALLLLYAPRAFAHGSRTDGRVAVAYGDPDTASDVAVCVPGLESSAAKLDQVGQDAVRLQREAQAVDPTRSSAVVAWQGYDAPEWTSVVGQARARAGGDLLAVDVAALVATHAGGHADPDPHLTVVGHSYGSTTTGLALQHSGLAASVDDVVVIGSPGLGGTATTVEGLGVTPAHLYVGSASRDVIHLASGTTLGTDPLAPGVGAVRFAAESVHRDDPGLLDALGVADHSRYYDPGSESLWSLGAVAAGHGQDLAGEGMVVDGPGRARSWTDPPPFAPGLRGLPLPPGVPVPPPYDDPEARRAPTGGHVHRLPS
ncbi:alpha/beta hydrolase [Lapillicoccus jejuensis]|uniref:Alpha/beta hydrolase family protein n=1 Tax=Lapillicoccus jejuensis TaxID=402171 RepID=A0A542DYB7_9MICO|nr:alpha/beta hydrolase [Lapillicoccus jejuensis]TQJ08093.1 alpha/beta hydrolase family protein [Lapillicoccus jejuensis]